MRAITFDAGQIRFSSNHPEPEPLPGEALVRTRLAGVNSTDVAVTRGMLGFTGVLGHLFVGTVEAVAGEDPSGLRGRRVAGSVIASCGGCDLCHAGLAAHCRQRTLLGLHKRHGCLAERFTMPVTSLVAVPDSVDDDEAVFAVTVAAARQTARQLTMEGKPYITVLGDGPLGLVTAQVLARLNASVRVIGRYPDKLVICEKWGIKHRHMNDIGRRADQDVVIDCTGSPHGLNLALQLVRPRGTIVLKSLFATDAREPETADLVPLVLNEVNLVGSFVGSVPEAVAMLARHEVDVISLITRRMSLEDGPALIAAAGKPGMLRVVVAI